MVKELEVKGASIKDAIDKGLARLGLKREDIEIKILDEGTTGLFGLVGSKPARIRIKSKNSESLSLPSDENTRNEIPASDKDKVIEMLNTIVESLIKYMKLSNMTADIKSDGEIYRIDINGPDKKLLIGRNGQTLNAVQLIVSLITGRGMNSRIKIEVDVDGYQKRRNEQLVKIANTAAQQVMQSGKIVKLEPMASRDRMTVHMALKDIDGVETVSEGVGATRRVSVRPK